MSSFAKKKLQAGLSLGENYFWPRPFSNIGKKLTLNFLQEGRRDSTFYQNNRNRIVKRFP